MAPEILVIDDDPAIRDALTVALAEEGYSVSTAANGREAMRRLADATSTPPALILLDLMMPVMDGVTFLDRYADDPTLPEVPVIVMSANLASIGVYRKDVLLYMNKPIALERLLETVGLWAPLAAERGDARRPPPPPRSFP